MFVYQVNHRPPERPSDEPETVVGIYLQRSEAIDVARHLDGEWWITEYGVGRIDPGTCIWTSQADAGGDEAKFFLRHWPVGFPYK